ncbi:MAG: beta-ketoacyl synthase N-terminal-like domain-containing protein [Myxococcaceae bacterium]
MSAAITSIGAVTGFGLGLDLTVSALLEGRTAIGPVTRFPTMGLCSSLASEAPADLELIAAAAQLHQPPAKDRASRLLLAALADALRGRSLEATRRRAVVVGTTKGALERGLSREERGIFPAEDLLGSPARTLAAATGSRGPVYTTGAACASSAVALGEALALVEDGVCDEVVVGGTEALHAFIYQGFHALKALSADPAAPFDAARKGLSLGEGAAVLLVESVAHARSQGRQPIALVEGFGTAVDGFDQTAPDPSGSGLLAACHRALAHSGVAAHEIDRYHAHGTGTVQNDRMEAVVHASLFPNRVVPVCAIKGAVGHTLGAAAAMDIAVCARTLAQQILPPVVNLRSLDASAAVPAIIGVGRRSSGSLALVANAGFGGINTAVVLRRPG